MKTNPSQFKAAYYRSISIYLTFSFFLSLLLLSCDTNEDESSKDQIDPKAELNEMVDEGDFSEFGEEGLTQVEIPENYAILDESMGDLDGDGIQEKVIVFDTGEEGDLGTEREVRIYVDLDGFWSLWHTARGPVLSSEHGGMMGDPYEGMVVKNGVVEFSHFGGSNEKWSYSHEFVFASEQWQLKAATLVFYQNCVYTETYTYNWNDGTGYHARHKEACNENGEKLETITEVEESLVLDKSNSIPTMNGFKPGETDVSVNNGADIYFY